MIPDCPVFLKKLLFTRCANSNGFCRCFAFQIGKICYHHGIIRHFQFRKCLPVYSNLKNSLASKLASNFWPFDPLTLVSYNCITDTWHRHSIPCTHVFTMCLCSIFARLWLFFCSVLFCSIILVSHRQNCASTKNKKGCCLSGELFIEQCRGNKKPFN